MERQKIKKKKKKSDDVLKNLEEFNKKQEEKRLKLEQETFNKSNYLILICIRFK